MNTNDEEREPMTEFKRGRYMADIQHATDYQLGVRKLEEYRQTLQRDPNNQYMIAFIQRWEQLEGGNW